MSRGAGGRITPPCRHLADVLMLLPWVCVPDGAATEDIPVISDECREEVYQFKISRNANINKNIPLGERGGGRDGRDARRLARGARHVLLTLPPGAPALVVRAAKACKVDAEKLCNTTWFFG